MAPWFAVASTPSCDFAFVYVYSATQRSDFVHRYVIEPTIAEFLLRNGAPSTSNSSSSAVDCFRSFSP